jgi:Protein of unknown function (DUF664)
MPGNAPPVANERQALREYLAHQQQAFVAVAFGLTDEQARSTPTVSALPIGGLIKHVTEVERNWMDRVKAAPDFPPADPRPMEEPMAGHQDGFVMREDETLDQLLTALKAQNAESLRRRRRPGHRDPHPAGRALVPQGCEGLVGALGRSPPDRRAQPARRARRHHSRDHRRRYPVRAAGRPRGLARDRLAQALEATVVTIAVHCVQSRCRLSANVF